MRQLRSQVAQVVTAAIDGSKASSDPSVLAKEIAAYLLDTGQTGQLDSLVRDIMQVRADNGIVEVVVRSATPLTAQVKTDITEAVRRLFPAADKIIISPVVDPSVVAGVKLELANQQLDLSVRAKLNRFKQLAGAMS